MYADDTTLMYDASRGLQYSLNCLNSYNNGDWAMEIGDLTMGIACITKMKITPKPPVMAWAAASLNSCLKKRIESNSPT